MVDLFLSACFVSYAGGPSRQKEILHFDLWPSLGPGTPKHAQAHVSGNPTAALLEMAMRRLVRSDSELILDRYSNVDTMMPSRPFLVPLRPRFDGPVFDEPVGRGAS